MKRIIQTFICIFIFAILSGCGSKEIKLTKDNVDDYIDISAAVKATQSTYGKGVYKTEKTSDGVTHNKYDDITFSISSYGASSNYDYKNVKITIEVYGKVNAFVEDYLNSSQSKVDNRRAVPTYFSRQVTLDTNISGKASETIYLSAKEITQNAEFTKGQYGSKLTTDWFLDYDSSNMAYDIISIEGSVTPAK